MSMDHSFICIFICFLCKKDSYDAFPFLHRAGTNYSVSVFGVFDGGQSMPLAGEEKTTLSDEPTSPPINAPGSVTA